MKRLTHGEMELAYLDEGEGAPIVLVHGFASDHSTNWVGPGWIAPLREAGFRILAPDNRGHGQSAKFHDPDDYALDKMAGDIAALIEAEADGGPVPVVGYSMGASISATLAIRHPEMVSTLVLAGVGENMLGGLVKRNEAIARGLEADEVPPKSEEVPRRFRLFAEQTGSDRIALAACMRGSPITYTADMLSKIKAPTLVIAGDADDVAQDPQPLADLIPGAECELVPRRDHMRAVGDKVTKEKVLAFLTKHEKGRTA